MTVSVVTAASAYPVTLEQAMDHCRVTDGEEATYLNGLIVKATEYAENYLHRRLIETSLRYTLDSFPGWESEETISLPQPPYRSLTGITYYDTDGTLTALCSTLTSTAVQIDPYSEPARIKPAYGTTWPATRDQLNAVTITYKAGYSTSSTGVPEAVQHAILYMVGHMYENREPVNIGNIVNTIDLTVNAMLDTATYNRVYVKD